MQEFICIDETLDIHSTSLYRISIQISPDGYSFSILDTLQNKHILLKHIPFFLKWKGELNEKIKEIYEKESILKEEFLSTTIIYGTSRATLVPPSFISDEDDHLHYFYYNFQPEKNELIATDAIEECDATVLYAIPKETEAILLHQFPHAKIRHHYGAFLDLSAKHPNLKTREAICFAHIGYNHLELAVFKDNQLQFCNQFYIKSPTDALYFIANTYKVHQLDAGVVDVIYSGIVDKKSDLFVMSKKYFRNVFLTGKNPNYQHSYTFNQIPATYFSTLINQNQCE
ncbi:DUF3822 family protein [Puteibacter caeruleilacunae]|nr:DUF3822 family protein [Puteibacter caeruleilacunae]